MLVYIDIETIPTQREEFKEKAAEDVKHPGNMKKKETIDAWYAINGDKAKDEAIKKTSFNGGMGELFCVALAIENNEPKVFAREDLTAKGEYELLTEINCFLKNVDNPTYIGHYISGFDLPFLFHRFCVHGIKVEFSLCRPDDREFKNSYEDTMLMWCGYRDKVSLDNLCLYLGVESSKALLDGSKVWDFVKNGKQEEVANYCLEDVKAVRRVYKKITNTLSGIKA